MDDTIETSKPSLLPPGINKFALGAAGVAALTFVVYYFTASYGKPELPSEAEYMYTYQSMFNIICFLLILLILISAGFSMGLDDKQIMISSGLIFVFLIYMTFMLYA